MAIFVSVDYMYYETPGTQQPSLQYQISCCLVSHPSNEPPYDWKDASVSTKFTCFWKNTVEDLVLVFVTLVLILQQTWPQGMPNVSLGHTVPNESPHFYSVSPPQKNSKGIKRHNKAFPFLSLMAQLTDD